jgi:glutamine synthetase
LDSMTPGMFGYSLLRIANQSYFQEVYDKCLDFKIPIEGLHTETGPGVYEAAITYTDSLTLADRAFLFKTVVKEIAQKHGKVLIN